MSTILIIPLIVFFFAIAIILKLNQAKIKGRFGEMKVSSILKSLPDNYHVFNDVYLQINGMSVQIDHIVISVYGIFVIETKNYTGWIFGTDNSEQWTKNVYGNKYEFRNPLKQNYAHVKALQCLLGLSKEKFIPAVVFLRGAVLKCNTQGTVIYSSQLKQFILSHTSAIIDSSNISIMRLPTRKGSSKTNARRKWTAYWTVSVALSGSANLPQLKKKTLN